MRRIVWILSSFALLWYFQGFAHGEDVKAKLKAMKPKDYPTQAIEFVVVYPAGGGMDVTARILAKYVEKYTDNRCVVVNKTGAAGLIGHTYLATQAKNDGYSVGIISTLFLTDDILRAKGKWSNKALEPLYYINEDPVTWIVSTDGPLKDKTLKDIIKMAKENPGTIKVAVSPDGSGQWVAEQVEMVSGVKFIKVPFQGGAPAVVAMLGGHIDIAGYYLPEYRGQLEAGKVKVLAQTGRERSIFLPDVPTYNEVLGVEDILWSAIRWAAVPKGIARDRFNYLEAAIAGALHDPECIKDFDQMGNKVGLKYLSGKQMSEEIERLYESQRKFFAVMGRISQ